MRAVVNRIELREPLSDEEFAAAQADLDKAAAGIEGLVAIHLLSLDEGGLIVLVLGEDDDALDRTRDELGNAVMRAHVIPHAAGPPDRALADVSVSYTRPG